MLINATLSTPQGISNPVVPVEDTAFYTNLGTGVNNNNVYASARQSDGKILLVGDFTSVNGITRNRMVRLNADGSVDTAFSSNLGTGFDNAIFGVKIQSDGKIIVAGNFTALNGNTRNKVLRLNSDGTEDSAFYTSLGTGFNNDASGIGIQSDGKIIIGGSFTTLNSVSRIRLVRLNSDGTLDSAFYTNLGTSVLNGSVATVNVQSDGKILLTGQFSSFNGNSRGGIFRLNSDGTEDTTFATNIGTASGFAINYSTVQSDGKILLTGFFNTFNGSTVNKLVRLNSDGTIDTAFQTNIGTAFSQITIGTATYFATVLSTGKIVVGGEFTLFNGNTRNRIVRLNSDGTEDTTYYGLLGTAFSGGLIYTLLADPTDRVVAAGAFTSFDGSTRNRVLRLATIP